MFLQCTILSRHELFYKKMNMHVFYRKANSDPVKQWLQAITKNGVPVLTCLTHADVLYSECAEEGRREDIGKELQVSH